MKSVFAQDKAAAIATLKEGGILAVPTETTYGLAVKHNNHVAINKLLALKERQLGGGKTLTMILPNVDAMKEYVEMNPNAINFARHYLPGELTVILPKRRNFKHGYFDNYDSICISISQHKYLQDLIKESGPLLMTGAHPHGKAPCYRSDDIRNALPGIDAVVEGDAGGNLPTTIIDLCGKQPRVIRQGGLLVVRY